MSYRANKSVRTNERTNEQADERGGRTARNIMLSPTLPGGEDAKKNENYRVPSALSYIRRGKTKQVLLTCPFYASVSCTKEVDASLNVGDGASRSPLIKHSRDHNADTLNTQTHTQTPDHITSIHDDDDNA